MLDLDLLPNAKKAIFCQLEPLSELVGLRNRGQASQLAQVLTIATPEERFERPTQTVAIVRQKREIIFQGLLLFKDLRTEDEPLKVWEGVLMLLTGFKPCPCEDGLYPLGRKLIEPDVNGFWTMEFKFGWQILHNEKNM